MSTFSTTKVINTADLRIGMYVSQLEIPWIATEFPLQGILVRNTQDIFNLSNYGKTVTIDQSRSLEKVQTGRSLPFSLNKSTTNSKSHRMQAKTLWPEYGEQNYRKTGPISSEIVQAHTILTQLIHIFDDIKLDLNRLDFEKTEELKSVSNDLVSSLLTNPDALLWLTKVNTSNRSVFEHTIRAAIWATLMARSMGLSQHMLYTLNLAVLLSGIGKSLLNTIVWHNYNHRAMQLDYSMWSTLTLENLAHCKNIGNRVISVIANMTERYNGSGFPKQRQTDEIPLLAQIASLAESFDLILQPIFSVKKMTFSRAISELYDLADTLFDGALIEEFVQATGLYPVGTHVLLSNGYYGVVIEQTKIRRIRATVVLTHDTAFRRLSRFKIIRLGEGRYHDVIIINEAEQMVDELVKGDLIKVNRLIGNYHSNFFLRILYFFRRSNNLLFRRYGCGI